MSTLATYLFGPLAVPECRRALARGWLVLLRAVAAAALVGVALAMVWWWWTAQQLDPAFTPYSTLRNGLQAILGVSLSLATILTPALIAGTLAGEKERGSMALLLTTRVSPREIVSGRILAKLSQIAMVLLAGLPGLVLLASLAGIGGVALATMIAQPMAVAFGIGGVAAATSAMSRRGRDALLVVYLLCVVSVTVSWVAEVLPPFAPYTWLAWLSPYHGVERLVWDEDASGSFGTMGLWLALGVIGVAVAAWRLRPSWLKASGGESRGKVGRRNLWVPPVGDRPMLWKELHIERAGSLGRAGKWLGLAIIAFLMVGSTTLAANVGWYLHVVHRPGVADQYRTMMASWYGEGALNFSGLIQLAVALRAAVAISSERERGTWDGLLTSPLEGGEIIRGKLWGSLYALRWLLIAALWSWTLCLGCGAMRPLEYAGVLVATVVISACAAAFGVRASLDTATATKSMTITVIIWLVTLALFAVIGTIVAGSLGVAAMFLTDQLYAYGLVATAGGPRMMGLVFSFAWYPAFLGCYLIATAIVVSEARLRFDRVSGRMTGGDMAVKFDEMIHGRPMEAVPIDETAPAPPVPRDSPRQLSESRRESTPASP